MSEQDAAPDIERRPVLFSGTAAILRLEIYMRRVGMLTRFLRLERGRQALLVEAAIILATASIAVSRLPFSYAIRFGSISPRRYRPVVSSNDCIWAVEVAARYLPLRAMCIEKGLAAQRLLRRCGKRALLHYGARTNPDTGQLEAHVWVTCNGEPVIGAAQAEGFAEIAVYPPRHPA